MNDKWPMVFLIIVIVNIFALCYSQINTLPRSKRYGKTIRSPRNNRILEKIKKQNQRINELLLKRMNRTEFSDQTQSYNITMGTRVLGELMTPIVSSNLSTPLVVETRGISIFPEGTRLTCKGAFKKNRIDTHCHFIILNNKQYPTDVQLLNTDLTAGLKGEVFTGDDARIMGLISADIWNSMTKKLPPVLLPGKTEISRLARKKSEKGQEVIVRVERGLAVFIYFKKGFKL